MHQDPSTDSDITAPKLPNDLETPCLVVDLARVRANLDRMAKLLADRGIALRPHFKTHKSIAVARMQAEAGAGGFTVATIGEAEVLAGAGFEDLFVAYPIWASPEKAARIDALRKRGRVAVGVESVTGAKRLGAFVTRGLEVLIEVDPGDGRTGVDPGSAGEVADAAVEAGLLVMGVFCHGGHSYAGPEAAGAAADDEVAVLARAMESLKAYGHNARIASAGSTPTATLSARPGVTEERPGTYVFQDRQQVHLGAAGSSDVALVVAATVVSTTSTKIVLDSGAKSLSKDRLAWMNGHGTIVGFPGCEIVRLYDHHAVAAIARGSDAPKIGDIVAIVPNHVCPVVNLFDEMVVVEGGAEVGRWPVDARGRNS